MAKDEVKVIAQNKKARHDYFIEETYEAGIVLSGTEVKSVRAGKVNLKDSYAMIKDGEVFINNMHISPYEKGNIFNKDPIRMRTVSYTHLDVYKRQPMSLKPYNSSCSLPTPIRLHNN